MRPKIVLLGNGLGKQLRRAVEGQYDLTVVSGVGRAMTVLQKVAITAVLVDQVSGSSNHVEGVHELKAAYPDLKVISIGTPKGKERSNGPQAGDYVDYPVDRSTLLRRLREICEPVTQGHVEFHYGDIVGESSALRSVLETVNRVAEFDCPVLVCGEHGTGKELVARHLHFRSDRRNHPFVAVGCGALAPTLLESELFGHERGAFTGAYSTTRGRFERAGRGTIFLDEIADLSQSLQMKLLRVLQEREFERVGGNAALKVRARVTAATNVDVEATVREGSFRQDLFYRLNVVNIFLPPLRDRREDIPLLAAHFLKKYGKACRRERVSLSDEVMEAFKKHHWEGNVRELENQIWRAICMCDGDVIRRKDVVLRARRISRERNPVTLKRSIGEISLPEAVKSLEESMICEALDKTNNVKAKASRLLGITERILGYKMRRYGISSRR